MLDHHGFDLWADQYDASVRQMEENNEYPFAGYTGLMNAIYGTVMHRAPARVLDIGFGTAMLTSKLYEAGNDITGFDFSEEMIAIAAAKMPKARLLQWDFTNGVPPALQGACFDFILSTYALHHLTDEAKAAFLLDLLPLLAPGGVILIGDVCFPSRDALNACRTACGDGWDADEIYFVVPELRDRLQDSCRLDFHACSFCAGIIEIHSLQQGKA